MNLGLKGKRAFVMGGGRGLGRGIAEALASEGSDVAIVSRNQDTLQRAAEDISRDTGSKILQFAADLADWASIENAFRNAEHALGAVDILINNSGGPPPSGVSGVAPALWSQQFEMMVLSLMRLTDLAVPGMRKRKWGRILTIASSGVVQPIPTIGMSNTLRSALAGWSKTLANEVAQDGITVNVLLPGRIATDRLRQLDEIAAQKANTSVEETMRNSCAHIPIGRYGTVEEFGSVAAFLSSAQASYITGSMIRIDGGMVRSV